MGWSLPPVRRVVVGCSATIAAFTLFVSCNGEPRILGPSPKPVADSKKPQASLADATLMVRTPTAEFGERGGTTIQFEVVLVKKNGKLLDHDQHMDWSSTDPLVATVDSTGFVTAQGVGSALIIVDYKDSADTVLVDVIPVPVVSITIDGPDSLSLDDDAHYSALPLDSAGEALDGRIVTWSSSVPSVASITPDGGDALALTVGSTDIIATCEELTHALTLQVWVQPVATVTVTPGTVSVPQFHKVEYSAELRDRRGKVLTGRSVVWSSSDPAIFYIKADADTAAGKDLGEAIVTATSEGKSGTAAVTVTNPVEARALWVTRFEYTLADRVDFAKITTIMQNAAKAHFNIVYFQVRTSGDALYFPSLEPCSPRMCRTLGGPLPAQDPLTVALAAAKDNNLELHAWLNAFTGFISGSTTACNQFITSTPANWLKAHPEWSVSSKNFSTGVLTRQVDNCVATSEYMWVSPGIPQVRTQLAQVAADIARKYRDKGLKGIHLDRIRYPLNTFSYDAPSQDAFKAVYGVFPASNAEARWQEFRRGFVNQGVKAVYDSVRAVDPSMVLSAAIFPGYKAIPGWAAAWSFSDYFQDPPAWALGGYLDVEVPMSYPATATSASWTVKEYCTNTDWTCVLDDHIKRIERQIGRQVYVGVAGIKGWVEMNKQIDLAHDRTATGMSVYSYSQVDAIPNAWTLLGTGAFKNKATIPAMPWKSSP